MGGRNTGTLLYDPPPHSLMTTGRGGQRAQVSTRGKRRGEGGVCRKISQSGEFEALVAMIQVPPRRRYRKWRAGISL